MRPTIVLLLALTACRTSALGLTGEGEVDGAAPGEDAGTPEDVRKPTPDLGRDQATATPDAREEPDLRPAPDLQPDLRVDPNRESWTAGLPGFTGTCDPRSGQPVQSGGSSCFCAWTCSPSDALPYQGSGRGTCVVNANPQAEDGMPCGQGVTTYTPETSSASGPTFPAETIVRNYDCQGGFMCLPAPAGKVWRAANLVAGRWSEGPGVCRRYCLEGGCSNGGACLPDLPCAKIGGVFGQEPQRIPGVGLCEPREPSSGGYNKSGFWSVAEQAWAP